MKSLKKLKFKHFITSMIMVALMVSSLPVVSASSVTGDCGSSTLYSQDGIQQLYWSIHPNKPIAYTAYLDIEIYKNTPSKTYVTSVPITTYGTGGASGSSGFVNYSNIFPELDPGQYFAELHGQVLFLDESGCSLGDNSNLYAGSTFWYYGGQPIIKPEDDVEL